MIAERPLSACVKSDARPQIRQYDLQNVHPTPRSKLCRDLHSDWEEPQGPASLLMGGELLIGGAAESSHPLPAALRYRGPRPTWRSGTVPLWVPQQHYWPAAVPRQSGGGRHRGGTGSRQIHCFRPGFGRGGRGPITRRDRQRHC